VPARLAVSRARCAPGQSPQRRSAAGSVSHQPWHDTRVSWISGRRDSVLRGPGQARSVWHRQQQVRAATPNGAWKAAQRKLKQLDLVTRLDDLQIPPGNNLHALKGDQAGRHAIKVNHQYRITFRCERTMPARVWLHLPADYDLQKALNEAKAAKRRVKRLA
jgi:plasmid maintenance system killer protein